MYLATPFTNTGTFQWLLLTCTFAHLPRQHFTKCCTKLKNYVINSGQLCNKLGSSSVLDVEGEFDEVLILEDIPKANPELIHYCGAHQIQTYLTNSKRMLQGGILSHILWNQVIACCLTPRKASLLFLSSGILERPCTNNHYHSTKR